MMLTGLQKSIGLTLGMTLGCLLAIPTGLHAQSRNATEPAKKSGTLTELASKGRLQILKYTDEAGEAQEVTLTAKIKVLVEAEGDKGFLKPGQFLGTTATESNQQLFADEVTIYLFGKKRPPAGRIKKADLKSGQSKNAYDVSGPILAIEPDPDYPEYQRVALKAAGPKAPLMLEEDVKVTVKSMDLSMAAAGTPIELTGNELRNGKFIVTGITAKLEEPLKSAEILKEASE